MEPLLTPGPSRGEAPDSVPLPLDARNIAGGISPGARRGRGRLSGAAQRWMPRGMTHKETARNVYPVAAHINFSSGIIKRSPRAPDLSGITQGANQIWISLRLHPDSLARGVSRSPRSRCRRPALLAMTCSPIVLSLLAGGTERAARTLVSGAVATKLIAQMGTIHSPHINIVAVSTKESNYAI